MRFLAVWCLSVIAFGQQPFFDRTHESKVFGQPRNYRILLPPGYETSGKRYPVIYYFHGHSDRYTLEHYDAGKDTIPKIAAFVAANEVIVVSVDGYVAADYTGFYGGTPWDVYSAGGRMDFGAYFVEFVDYIDATYRTLTDRRHRATSGLSMGGFMSLYLSARYPQLIGSASAFNPGPEFFTGDPGRRMLWRPKDHVKSHTATMIRLVRASGDYISQYHEETHDAYARAQDVDFEYRQDEYHRHWATSIGETFDFHKRAFSKSSLDNVPVRWNHSNAYRAFDVWGWHVETAGGGGGYTELEDVTQTGLRIRTRQWAPDGPAVTDRTLQITTAPLYTPGGKYKVLDYALSTGRTSSSDVMADSTGRLHLQIDGSGHQLSFTGPGAGAQAPVLLPVTSSDMLRLPAGHPVSLPLKIWNPRKEPLPDVNVSLSSRYPTVAIPNATFTLPSIGPGEAVDVSGRFPVTLTAGSGYFERARLHLVLTYDGYHTAEEDIDILVTPEDVPPPHAVEILDGRTVTLNVFRQKGNQGGGGPVQRTITEGKGNGNGILEPGEEATVWVKMRQGMDPFDKNNWYRTKVYTDSPWIAEIADIQEQKQLEWTGAKERTSLVRLSARTPPGTPIPLLLDNESWSYYFTPEVRYGTQLLYQAYQRHTRHLHQLELKAGPSQP